MEWKYYFRMAQRKGWRSQSKGCLPTKTNAFFFKKKKSQGRLACLSQSTWYSGKNEPPRKASTWPPLYKQSCLHRINLEVEWQCVKGPSPISSLLKFSESYLAPSWKLRAHGLCIPMHGDVMEVHLAPIRQLEPLKLGLPIVQNRDNPNFGELCSHTGVLHWCMWGYFTPTTWVHFSSMYIHIHICMYFSSVIWGE